VKLGHQHQGEISRVTVPGAFGKPDDIAECKTLSTFYFSGVNYGQGERLSLKYKSSEKFLCLAGFQVLTAVIKNRSTFSKISPCSPVRINVSEEHESSIFSVKK
jgi:hypothetical protein